MKPDVTLKKLVGQPVKRTEDRRLLMGRGTFIEDMNPVPFIHHAAVIRSPYAHAKILSLDAEAALSMPGVVGILTGQDVLRMSKPFPVGIETPNLYYSLATDKVRYTGEPVAVIVARTRYQAEDAAELVMVDYDPLPAVVDAEKAAQPGAPLLHEYLGTNVVANRVMKWGEPDRAFEEADLVVSGRFVFPKYGSTPMETFGIISQWDPAHGEYTIWSNFHGPFSMHPVMAQALKVAGNKLRFIAPRDIGGGFGIKSSIYPNMAMVALAARKCGVPVKWIEDRREHLINGSSGADRITYAEMAFKKDGTMTGYRNTWYDNVGGYVRAPEPACSFRTHGNYVGPYRVKNTALDARVVVTNKSLTGPNRGYGCQQLYLPAERLLDRAAEELGLDPVEIRMKNLISPEEMPYTTPTGGIYDSGDYPKALKMATELIKYEDLIKERDRARSEGRLFGIGIALAVDPSVSNMGYVTIAFDPHTRQKPTYKEKGAANETAQIRIDPLGKVTVLLNSVPQGQGHETITAQIVADELGIDPQEINVISEFDTHTRAWSITAGSYSSRFASVTSSAIAGAAKEMRRKILEIAAFNLKAGLEDLELAGGLIFAKSDPAKSIKFHHLTGLAHWNQNALPPGVAPGLNVVHTFAFERALPPDNLDRVQSSQTYGFIAEIIAVELDPETYKLEFKKYVSVHDAGKVINPLLLEGQVYGGAAHGIGGALYEEMVYDEDGQYLAGTMMDYLCPTALEIPEIIMGHVETPSPWTVLGSKGAGESSTMTAPVAIANAVADALRPLGIYLQELPVSPSKLWTLVNQARSQGQQEDGGNIVKFDGTEIFPAPREVVWTMMQDPAVLTACIPGCEKLEPTEPGHYTATLAIGIGAIKGRYQGKVQVSDQKPPESYRLAIEGKGVPGWVKAAIDFDLVQVDDSTSVRYQVEAQVGGLVASVGSRMLQGVAKMLFGDMFKNMQKQLAQRSQANAG